MSDAELAYAVGQTVEVTAVDVAQGGWCVARPEGLPVLFVRHALPGERVLARVTEVTSRFARADAIEVREASPDRVEPPCPNAHPGGCGGCDWQHASLPAQRALKAAVIAQQLRRVAGLEPEVTVEALPGDEDGDRPDERQTGAASRGSAGAPGSSSRSARTAWPGSARTARTRSSTSGTARSRTPRSAIWACSTTPGRARARSRPRPAARAGRPRGTRTASVILTKAGRAPRGRRAPGSVPGHRAARDERGRDVRVRSEDRAVEVFPQDGRGRGRSGVGADPLRPPADPAARAPVP